MHKLKKALLPLVLAIAMLVMAVSAGAANSPTGRKVNKISSLSTTSYTYNKEYKKPSPTVLDENGNPIDKQYLSVKYTENIKAGTATITVTGKNPYAGSESMTFTIKRAKAYALVNGKTKVTLAKGKSANFGLYLAKGNGEYTESKGPKVLSVKSSSKNITVTKAGKITVKKGAKKGTYKITVSISGTGRNYAAVTRTITVVVK